MQFLKDDATKAIEVLHKFEEASNASIIGKVTAQYPQKVILNTSWGTKRFLEIHQLVNCFPGYVDKLR